MALVKCPECGLENIQSTIKACPNCGFPIGKHFGGQYSDNQFPHKQVGEQVQVLSVPTLLSEPNKGFNYQDKDDVVDNNTGKDESHHTKTSAPAEHSSASKVLYVMAVILFILSAIMLYNGHDKMTRYSNSEYSFSNKNAYVGGDAYNYIINGTYATGYFVLSSGFLISGIICVVGGILNDK